MAKKNEKPRKEVQLYAKPIWSLVASCIFGNHTYFYFYIKKTETVQHDPYQKL